MTIEAKVIADSVARSHDYKESDSCKRDHRITTVALKYPRFIHAELMTHRVFSRNASSSRAIPVERMIEFIKEDTAMPIHWGKNQKGMQASKESYPTVEIVRSGGYFMPEDTVTFSCEEQWLKARDAAIDAAMSFHEAGYHKQIVNRLLEPFAHINVLVTATDWDNWFELRDHPDAQPEIKALAQAIRKAMAESTPNRVERSEWHMPYINLDTCVEAAMWHRTITGEAPSVIDVRKICLKVSAARCARVSYKTFDGKTSTVEKDLNLFEQLAGGRPLHASPLEHQATPTSAPYAWINPVSGEYMISDDDVRMKQRNFTGWVQHRAFWEDSIKKGEARV